MGNLLRSILLGCAICLAVSSVNAYAGQYSNQCQSAGNSSNEKCNGAVTTAQAADNAQAAGNISGVGSSQTINPGAGAQNSQISAQIARIQSALATCKQAKSDCESKCSSAKAQAQADYQARMSGEPRQVDQVKQNKCTKPLDASIKKLESALNDLGQNSKDTKKTDDASENKDKGGQQQQPQMPQQSDNSSSDTSKSEETLDCSKAGNDRYSDCNSHYVSQCANDFSSEACSRFANRYCNLGGVSGSADVAITAPLDAGGSLSQFNNKSYVVDKKGEGMGSDFCSRANSYQFCQTSGREGCPSCQNGASSTTEQLNSALNTCPSDPIFMNPAVRAKMSDTGTPATSYSEQSLGSSSKGLGSSSTGTSSPSSGSNKGISEGSPRGLKEDVKGDGGSASNLPRLDVGVASGSGGGGGYGGRSDNGSSYDRDNRRKGLGANSATKGPAPSSERPADAVVGMNSTDVSRQLGPNVFSIVESTLKSRCKRDLLHCR